ncbi:hypothetical protein GCM10012275_04950 [Longimycelium tulufanense]|uniref:HTH luxR-type domain-containing protein n=1 Tax=Longimycelium tulufanense TaxID=907463 RepID=A0A8J3C7P9_9PSEU|nr:helix-turn-helix transcriptional regulator [Longimycelium tulufanense]GGM36819.1 hypothetical protein GCM10012275_04950 [Longimycelium tulufanense]
MGPSTVVRPPSPGGRTITDRKELRVALRRLGGAVRQRVLRVLADPPPGRALLQELRLTDQPLLGRGVELRLLCPPSYLDLPSVRGYLADLAGRGARVRLAPAVVHRLAVFDRAVAVLPVDPAEPAAGTVLVDDPCVVRAVESLASGLWETGQPLPDRAADPVSLVEHRVLRMLDGGLTDETAARRLSMSERTFRRHVARMMVRLGASSRFQAGAAAVRRGWL